MARRVSGSGPSYGYPLLNDYIKRFDEKIDLIADRIETNKEGMPETVLKEWQTRLIEVVREAAILKNEKEAAREVLNSVLGSRSLSGVEDANTNEEQMRKRIVTDIANRISSFQPENDTFVQNIREMFNAPENQEVGDDDFVLMDTGMTKSDTICPYTLMTLVEPMMNPSCKHHVSRQAFDEVMFRGGAHQNKCPVAGCNATWLKSKCKLDEDFDRKMKRFLRRQQREEEFARARGSAEELDDSYTKV